DNKDPVDIGNADREPHLVDRTVLDVPVDGERCSERLAVSLGTLRDSVLAVEVRDKDDTGGVHGDLQVDLEIALRIRRRVERLRRAPRRAAVVGAPNHRGRTRTWRAAPHWADVAPRDRHVPAADG